MSTNLNESDNDDDKKQGTDTPKPKHPGRPSKKGENPLECYICKLVKPPAKFNMKSGERLAKQINKDNIYCCYLCYDKEKRQVDKINFKKRSVQFDNVFKNTNWWK